MIGKAECLQKFVGTSLSADEFDARTLYEDTYCGRGDIENHIKSLSRAESKEATTLSFR